MIHSSPRRRRPGGKYRDDAKPLDSRLRGNERNEFLCFEVSVTPPRIGSAASSWAWSWAFWPRPSPSGGSTIFSKASAAPRWRKSAARRSRSSNSAGPITSASSSSAARSASRSRRNRPRRSVSNARCCSEWSTMPGSTSARGRWGSVCPTRKSSAASPKIRRSAARPASSIAAASINSCAPSA